jgi:Domain of unknown function (DUF4129)
MPSHRPDKTLVDYMAIAISPALIMVLVGSLAFFLLEVFYRGAYGGRLDWIVGCFVFAAVLIARISMEEGAERASLYGAMLAMAAGFVMMTFVDYFLLAWIVLAIIWFCAHELTWNCTLIDETADASGEGLLQAAGLDDAPVGSASADAARTEQPDVASEQKARTSFSREPKASVTEAASESRAANQQMAIVLGRRIFNWFTHRRHRNAPPGLYVVYFSLAALPIFGFGQLLLPPLDLAKRQSIYWLVFWYVASALGLLLTTCFLGLRRYLRQRKLQMPVEMAGMWLTVGAAMIVVMLVVAAIIPRPNPEYAVSALSGSLGSPNLNASRYAPLDDSPAEDPQQKSLSQAPATEETPPEAADTARTDQPGSAESKTDKSQPDRQGQDKGASTGDKQGKSGQASKGGKSADSKSADGKSNDNKSGDASRGSGDDRSKAKAAGEQKSGGRKSGEQNSGGKKSGDNATPDADASENPRRDDANKTDASRDERSGSREKQPSDSDANKSRGGSTRTSPPPRPAGRPWFTPPSAGWLLPIVKVLLYLAIVVVGTYLLIRYWTQVRAWLARFWQELLDFWNNVFASRRATGIVDSATEAIPKSRPFAAFHDPFASGTAKGVPVAELVRYTFEALEAWAEERGLPRSPDETPLEFAARVGDAVPAVAGGVRELAGLYARVAYARQSLPASCSTSLARCWQAMRAAAERGVESASGA